MAQMKIATEVFAKFEEWYSDKGSPQINQLELLVELHARFLESYSESIPKKHSGRSSTVPGAPFNVKLCHCRLYDKSGHHKQCSASVQEDTNYCKLHARKVSETTEGIWKFGNYNEEVPKVHLSGKEKGNSIAWKMDGFIQEKPSRKKKAPSKKDLPEGHHARPRGRAPNGKEWNYERGEWNDTDISLKLDITTDNCEYLSMKVSGLKKLAIEKGISHEEIEQTDDEDDRKTALIGLIISKDKLQESESSPESGSESAKTEPLTPKSNSDEERQVASEPEPEPEPQPEPEPEPETQQEPEPESIPTKEELGSVCAQISKEFGLKKPEKTEGVKEETKNVAEDGEVTIDGYSYLWDTESNELTDPETYDLIGKLSIDKKSIIFENDEMEEHHKENVAK